MTSVNGAQIVYDAMGNPTTYKGNTFTWEQGRKLASGSMGGKSFTYSYDGNGMRYKKTVSGTTTYYYYDGTQLLMESKNGQRIWYIYGVTGIEGMVREDGSNNTITYFFDKNTLGDVVAIRDVRGYIVGTYEYDAWGNVTSQTGDISEINPFRYRGYYYDNETGFYYLQTRYYDSTICRFINADNYELIAELSCVAGQLNLYAYANNNPIMCTDESGELAIATTLIVLGVLLFTPVGGAVAQVAISAVSYVGVAAVAGVDYLINGGNGGFYQDMSAIGWNPFNAKVDNVMSANRVSFYKGIPVFFVSERDGSMSLGAIFFDKSQGAEVLKHETGHNVQLMSMGLGNYLIQIGIPSVWKNGDETPWELSASLLGGSALADGYLGKQIWQAQNYFIRSIIPFVSIYNIFQYIFY